MGLSLRVVDNTIVERIFNQVNATDYEQKFKDEYKKGAEDSQEGALPCYMPPRNLISFTRLALLTIF